MKHALPPLLLLAVCACGSKDKEKEKGPTSVVTEENVNKAKEAIKPPMPAAEAKQKIVAILGEPTATDGESLIWAGVNGNECRELKLMVQRGEAIGTTSGMAHKIVESEFKKCEAHAAGK